MLPLRTAYQGVSFAFIAFLIPNRGLFMYTKHALTIDEQIDQLSQRGLLIDEDAVHFLSHISYYRLAGYWWPMQKEPKEEHLL